MELLEEHWVPVHGYEDRYAISDHGRVKSLAKIVQLRASGAIVGKRRIS